MSELSRIGVAIESELLSRFDEFIERRSYPNRSEAFRDLIREALITDQLAAPSAQVLGSLTLVYDHHIRLLTEKLNEVQHDHHQLIVSTLHVHVDHDHCMEVLLLRGKNEEVRRLSDRLITTKGVLFGKLTLATPEGK